MTPINAFDEVAKVQMMTQHRGGLQCGKEYYFLC